MAPHPNDVLVGNNLRVYRLAAKMSQTDLGTQIGVTFQQIQKYEKGTNRVGAGRLLAIAGVLDVPVKSFFDGVKGAGKGRAPIEFLSKRDAFKLAEAFEKITEQRVRNSVVALVVGLSNSE
jgi:transcriptional regulator with XRE-family HTH domain